MRNSPHQDSRQGAGVGYRFYARVARRLGLKGGFRTCGTAGLAVVEGDPQDRRWITEIKEGPAGSRRIDQERREGAGPLGDFDVKF
jgi:hypothetical protein